MSSITPTPVLGIGANRLIASRKHAFSYIDDSPRLMSEEEQAKVFGEVSPGKLQAVTVLKDMKTGATARGYGSWPKDTEPKGTDKGNSKANMAFIRSERQALDRLYPADMPRNVEVVDERYEVTATVETPTQTPPGDATVKATTAEEDWDKMHRPEGVKPPASPPVPATSAQTAQAVTATSEGEDKTGPTEKANPKFDIDILNESLAKLQTRVPKSWGSAIVIDRMKKTYKVKGTDAIEMAQQLEKGQLAHFLNSVQEALDMA